MEKETLNLTYSDVVAIQFALKRYADWFEKGEMIQEANDIRRIKELVEDQTSRPLLVKII